MRVTYIGLHEEVWVPDIRLNVKHGETVEVADELADGLLCQQANWSREETKAQRDVRLAAESAAIAARAAADEEAAIAAAAAKAAVDKHRAAQQRQVAAAEAERAEEQAAGDKAAAIAIERVRTERAKKGSGS